jgi:UDPglucose 6-dehydrogenase
MIGTGYVGLVSGACFADFGHEVTCVDLNAERIESLKKGVIPIFEPGLDDIVHHNARDGRLQFSTESQDAVASADVVFIGVGTPERKDNGNADLTYVYQAAREIARQMSGYTVIVSKSTVPVGTGDEIESIVRQERPTAEFSVVSNPEFLREGAAIHDFKLPDRIVVGVEDERAREVMAEVYRPLFINQAPIMFTGRRTAELIKYAANAFLATKISFINEMADLCERAGANVQEVARGIGLDNRIGTKFLHAGPGYGGSCFPKDTMALIRTAEALGAPLTIVDAVARANIKRKQAMADRVISACQGSVQGKTIGVLGLAFKPKTDDMREAPSIDLIENLLARGAKVKAFDPEAVDQARKVMSGVVFCGSAYACLDGSDAAVLMTEWEEFRALDLDRMLSIMKSPVMVDLRNVYRPEVMRKKGFSYTSVGRP